MNFAKNGPGTFRSSVLEVKYGTRKKSRKAIGIVQGVRMTSASAISGPRIVLEILDRKENIQ